MKSLPGLLGAALAAATMLVTAAAARPVPDLLDRPAVAMRSPAEAVLLDITRAGERLVAVGEHGIIILSEDAGVTWRQARVPVSVGLTAVRFVTPSRGWAVGHSGVVLATADGGETWTRQLDGRQVSALVLAAAERDAATSPSGDENAAKRLTVARRMAREGADKPFFAVHFDDESAGFAIGASNLILRTQDGGANWQPWMGHLPSVDDYHFYAIAKDGGMLLIAGEQGTLLRSRDNGETFAAVDAPYGGTFFAAAVQPGGPTIVAGLRGNAFASADGGAGWSKLELATPTSLGAALPLAGGDFLLADQSGRLFRGKGGALREVTPAASSLSPTAAVVTLPDGRIVGVGPRGVWRATLSPAKP